MGRKCSGTKSSLGEACSCSRAPSSLLLRGEGWACWQVSGQLGIHLSCNFILDYTALSQHQGKRHNSSLGQFTSSFPRTAHSSDTTNWAIPTQITGLVSHIESTLRTYPLPTAAQSWHKAATVVIKTLQKMAHCRPLGAEGRSGAVARDSTGSPISCCGPGPEFKDCTKKVEGLKKG